MRSFRACLALLLLILPAITLADDEGSPELVTPDLALASPTGPAIIRQNAVPDCDCLTHSYCFGPGLFAGVGGSYNSVKVDQNISGSAVSEVISGPTLVAFGEAGGPAPPFHNTLTTFAPVGQVGYFKCSPDGLVWGTKFAYKYLGLTFTDPDVVSPQAGTLTTTTASPDAFTGHATGQSAQLTVNHELAVLSFIGHSFDRGHAYLGAGPAVFATRTRLNDVSGFADVNGVHFDVTGTPLNFQSETWMWGGAVQGGVVYYLGPNSFLDLSYDFMITADYNHDYSAPFTSDSGGFTTVGSLALSTEQRITAQSFSLSLNVMF